MAINYFERAIKRWKRAIRKWPSLHPPPPQPNSWLYFKFSFSFLTNTQLSLVGGSLAIHLFAIAIKFLLPLLT